MGTLVLMNRRTDDQPGDTRLIWNPDNADEVAASRKMFDGLRKKGFFAYKVTRKGDKGEMITTFDPEAEKIIMAPPLAGG